MYGLRKAKKVTKIIKISKKELRVNISSADKIKITNTNFSQNLVLYLY